MGFRRVVRILEGIAPADMTRVRREMVEGIDSYFFFALHGAET